MASSGQTVGATTDLAETVVKSGLNDRQQIAVMAYLSGKSKIEAAIEAGYSDTSGTAVFRTAKMQAVYAAAMDRFLVGELAPQAIHTISRLLDDSKTPAGVRATLALGVLDRAGFSAKRHEKPGGSDKDPSTMTAADLQSEIDRLQREIDARMRDVTPVSAPITQQELDLYE